MDGGGLDGLVTARQMVVAGLASFSSNTIGSPAGTVVSVPSPPTGLAGSGALAAVIVTWNKPTYTGHSHTEIWAAAQTAAQVAASEAPLISQAVVVGISAGEIFSHTIGGSATRYYWAKNINQNGVASAFNATAGVSASTGDNPDYLIDVLSTSTAYSGTSAAPFFQIDEATVINGVEIPAGTYITAAYIADATITRAKIGNAAIDNAKIDSLDAAKITTGTLSANRIGANSIVAGKINTNGLSIKDASGNIILSAGSPLGGDLAGIRYMSGAMPAYNNNDVTTISLAPDGATKLHDGADNILGMAYPAFSVNATTGQVWRITLAVRDDAGGSQTGGLYIRVYEYDSDLPSGKTHVSHFALNNNSDPVVQQMTRQSYFLYNGNTNGIENEDPSSTYKTYTLAYTPTATAKWASVTVLNGSQNGANPLYVKDVNVALQTLTAAGIAGQGAFATESQITVGNASTYIASVAITGALIGNGEITNAKIGNEIKSTNHAVDGSGNTTAGWRILKDGQMDMKDATFRGVINVASAAGTGERTEITNNGVKVYDAQNQVRVKLGLL